MVDYRVRAMTWNIWWRFGPRWRERQPGILATIQRFTPDVVGLQEVWSSEGRTQADELAEALGCDATFAAPSYPAAPDPPVAPDHAGVELGVALLSRWPIRAARRDHDAGSPPRLGPSDSQGLARPSGRAAACAGGVS
jgi:endonuclease/exonuclease/phosphatase family metal-dependent hydrolase